MSGSRLTGTREQFVHPAIPAKATATRTRKIVERMRFMPVPPPRPPGCATAVCVSPNRHRQNDRQSRVIRRETAAASRARGHLSLRDRNSSPSKVDCDLGPGGPARELTPSLKRALSSQIFRGLYRGPLWNSSFDPPLRIVAVPHQHSIPPFPVGWHVLLWKHVQVQHFRLTGGVIARRCRISTELL